MKIIAEGQRVLKEAKYHISEGQRHKEARKDQQKGKESLGKAKSSRIAEGQGILKEAKYNSEEDQKA